MEKCPVPIHQDPKELADLITEVKKINPKNVLEIGSLQGGTLWTWLNELKPDYLCSIDLCVPLEDPRSVDQQAGHNGLWREWGKHVFCDVDVLNAHSNSVKALKFMSQYDLRFDFVFIDGGHSYDEVMADYSGAFHFTKPGSIMAFHDINEFTCPDVIRFWNEIKDKHRSKEFKYLEGKWGIGMIYVD